MRLTTLRNLRTLASLSVAVIAVSAAACATGGSGPSGPRTDPSRMDTTQMRGHNYGNVYDAIQRLHADWLVPRGGANASGTPTVGVFMEGERRDRTVSYLREIRPEEITSARRLSQTESLQDYGWPWGAIVLRRR